MREAFMHFIADYGQIIFKLGIGLTLTGLALATVAIILKRR